MIAFTISLTENDWDPNINGWRCPVLRIPGAQVDAMYSSGKVDDASYKPVPEQGFVRWGGSGQPKSPTLAINLTQTLAPKEERDFWKNVGIVAPIIVAAIAGASGVLVERMKQPTAAVAAATAASAAAASGKSGTGIGLYEKWTVNGQVAGEAQFYEIKAKIFPPDIPMTHPQGRFSSSIPVERDDKGGLNFPSITFDAQRPGFVPVTVDLDRTPSVAPRPAASDAGTGYDMPDYALVFDDQKKQVHIGKPIRIMRVHEPYLAAGSASAPGGRRNR
jgi:hypothetical protein